MKTKKRVPQIDLINFKSDSLSNQLWNKKWFKSIQLESSLQKDFVYLLEFDRAVCSYIEKPIDIPFIDSNGISKKYFPDFAINYHNKFRKDEIIEVIYDYELEEKTREFDIMFESARKYCINNELVFRVISDKYIRNEKNILLKNIKFLSRYKHAFDKTDYETPGLGSVISYGCILLDKVQEIDKCTPDKLINSITNDWEKKAELLFLIWYLIANNFIECDLNYPLNLNSIIWYDF